MAIVSFIPIHRGKKLNTLTFHKEHNYVHTMTPKKETLKTRLGKQTTATEVNHKQTKTKTLLKLDLKMLEHPTLSKPTPCYWPWQGEAAERGGAATGLVEDVDASQ